MTNQPNSDPIAAIRVFPFDGYGLDDVSYLLESEPDTQEWVTPLAAAVTAAAYRQAADDIVTARELRDWTDDHMGDIHAAADYLRRRAADIETGEQR